MEKFLIPVAIEKASFSDCFHKDGTCIENKMFFLKNYFSNKLSGYYSIPDGSGKETYWVKELQKLLVLNLIFMVKPVLPNSDFVIKLAVEEATEYNFFCGPDLLTDVIFYVDTQNGVQGPFNSNQFSAKRIKSGLLQKNIFVPSKQQTFEQIENKQIA